MSKSQIQLDPLRHNAMLVNIGLTAAMPGAKTSRRDVMIRDPRGDLLGGDREVLLRDRNA